MLPKGAYDPLTEELEILNYWLENKFYKPEYNPTSGQIMSTEEMKNDGRESFCIVNPPPNAYARPHIGNVSGYAYQDFFARYARMNGKKVVMMPGKDHAGQEGEAVFIKTKLLPQGKKKSDFTREEFYKLTYQHNDENMELALSDEKRVGLTSDFDRNLFTLDPRAVGIVLDTFMKMYHDDMIYKGVRIINWSPGMQSAISDNDTARITREADLTYIKYPLIPRGVDVWHLNFRDHEIFQLVVEGKKSIETRALNPEEPEKYLGNVKEGDWIVCIDKTDSNNSQLFTAKRLKTYSSVKEVYESEDISKIFPGYEIKDIQTLENLYAGLAQGYLERIQKNGIIAIELEARDWRLEIPQTGQAGNFIEVATTRPETMLGDTAVVVDPSDERYQNLIGKYCLLPLVNRKIPIIANGKVDKEFGTGAVKMTPAHSQDDYYMAQEWNVLDEQLDKNADEQGRVLTDALGYIESKNITSWKQIRKSVGKIPYINVIGKDLKIHGPVGKYVGLEIDDARTEVVKDLNDLGLISKVEKIEQNVTICDRTKTVVEPMMSSQWFVDVNKKDFRQNAIRAIENGLSNAETRFIASPEGTEHRSVQSTDNAVRIHPENMAHKALHWMNNLRDWPISRSVWWGYRIPVWYKGKVEEYIDIDGQIRQMIDGNEFVNLQEAAEKGMVYVGVASPDSVQLDILRHGEATHNINGSFAGSKTDTKLTEDGIRAAELFAKELETEYDLIISSPQKRALKTAQITAAKFNTEVITNELLVERDFGELEGLTWEEFEAKYPDLAKMNNPIYQPHLPNGETIEQVEERVEKFIKELSKEYSGKKILVVTHAGIIRIFKRKLQAVSYEESRTQDILNLQRISTYIPNPQSVWIQDPDCLDTWFSSGQWPFVTLETFNIADTFYPTSIMETAYDILEPWVCRMIMFGMYRKGIVPFKDVYLHGLIKAEDGQKMSKSKGNVVYTDDIILKYGADNIRLFYISGNKAGAGYRIDWEKIEGNKRFLNKLWNASRFVLMNIEALNEGGQALARLSELKLPDPRLDETEWNTAQMQFITSLQQESNQSLYKHLSDLYRETTRRIDTFNVGVALQELTNEFWHTFCDIHLETAKVHIYPQRNPETKEIISEPTTEEKDETAVVLKLALKTYLKMMHPFIPFITERLWKELPKEEGDHETLMYTRW
jgi:valyl-tRNA synthetase